MTRPVVGVCAAVHPARFGPWNQDVAMVPSSVVAAVHALGWLALVISADSALATGPDEVLQMLDGLIVPEWATRADRNADFSRSLAAAAEARGVSVVRLDESLLVPDSTVADYRRAIGKLFTRDPRVSRA